MATKNVRVRFSEQGASKVNASQNRIDAGFKRMAASALKYAGAYFGARGIIRGINAAVRAYGVQEKAEKQLEVALGRTSKALLEQAAALQQMTAYGDETIISAQALIAAFVKDEDQIKKATRATLDLAAAKGFDLRNAADLVSKTLGSTTNALTRYGIQVEGAVGSTERLESLTTNIARVFGGQAAAATETMTGQISQMENAIGDAAEQIGRGLSPAIKNISQQIKELVEAEWFVRFGDALSRIFTSTEDDIKNFWEITKEGSEGAQQRLNQLITLSETFAELREQDDYGVEGLKIAYEALGLAWDEADESGKNYLTVLRAITEAERQLAIARQQEAEARRMSAEMAQLEAEVRNQEVQGRVEQNGYLFQQIQLKESLSDVTNDLRTDTQKWVDANEASIDSMLKGVAMYGNLEEQSKALASQFIVEGVYAAVKSALVNVPFPWNLAAAGGAAIAANALFSTAVDQFATGGDFVTSGPRMIMVGDNPGGRERVQVTPIGSPNVNGPREQQVIINVNASVVDEYSLTHTLIPAINRAVSDGKARLNA